MTGLKMGGRSWWLRRKEGLVVNRRRVLRLMRERGRAGLTVGWAYLARVVDRHTPEVVGWDLSARCRIHEALTAVERAVLERLPAGSRGIGLTLTRKSGTQFTSARFL